MPHLYRSQSTLYKFPPNPDHPGPPKFQNPLSRIYTTTIMFLTRVAGPSRLPFRAAEPILRRANSTSPAAAAASPTTTTEPTGDELADRDSRAAFSREKELWASEEGYRRWKGSMGAQYKSAGRGDKAAWLGGNVVSLYRSRKSPLVIYYYIPAVVRLRYVTSITCSSPSRTHRTHPSSHPRRSRTSCKTSSTAI